MKWSKASRNKENKMYPDKLWIWKNKIRLENKRVRSRQEAKQREVKWREKRIEVSKLL